MATRNPNGYGCVRHLSGKRSRPWAILVTTKCESQKRKQVAAGYARTKAEALQQLAQYRASHDELADRPMTLSALYKRWTEDMAFHFSKSLSSSLHAAYMHCSSLYYIPYVEIKGVDMQRCIDTCACGVSSQSAIRNLFRHLDRYAYDADLIDRRRSELLTVQKGGVIKHRKPISVGHINTLWSLQGEKGVDTVLIFIYTGLRLMELLTLKKEQVDLEKGVIIGGSKTQAGKDRVIPIHPRIRPLIERRMQSEGSYLITKRDGSKMSKSYYYTLWRGIMRRIGGEYTPHEARHTLETMLDDAGVDRKCIDLILGHSSGSTGLRVYTHKTVEQLKQAIKRVA